MREQPSGTRTLPSWRRVSSTAYAVPDLRGLTEMNPYAGREIAGFYGFDEV
jgi:hypothetical protein